LLAAGVAGALLFAGVVSGGPAPETYELERVEAEVQRVPPATARAAGALPAAKKKKQKLKVVATDEITVTTGQGALASAGCPSGYVAVSGGIVNVDNATKLSLSHSAPSNPVTGQFSKNTWYAAATNTGEPDALHFRVVVSCLNRIK
jgi:hypothetical protein